MSSFWQEMYAYYDSRRDQAARDEAFELDVDSFCDHVTLSVYELDYLSGYVKIYHKYTSRSQDM